MDFPWRVKQRQADMHLAQLTVDCSEYVDAAKVGFENEIDEDRGTIMVTLRADFEPPAKLGATIGDVLHNLRSALDAVAWATCQRAGVPPELERHVYFPISMDPSSWTSLSKQQLPAVKPDHREVFRQLQPWFWDEEARALGVDMPSTAERHPLARLHRLARDDRHRVPHPVLARAGDSWLGTPEGVTAEILQGNSRGTAPGDVVLEWRLTPAGAVSDVSPGGDVVLALSDESAKQRRSAINELQKMQQAVIEATRRVEVDVLQVIRREDMAELGRLNTAFNRATVALNALIDSDHVIDRAYMDEYHDAAAAETAAKAAYIELWRELFD